MPLIKRWSALDRFHREIETRVERRLHQHVRLQAHQFYALSVLQEKTSAPAQQLYVSDLAGKIGLGQSATSRLVFRSRDRGLVATRTSAHDRRSVEVQLTSVAHEVLRLGMPILHRTVDEAMQAAGARNTDCRLLRYLQGALDASSPAAGGQSLPAGCC
jgi:DNA-binding MarR family transcriptional regulator